MTSAASLEIPDLFRGELILPSDPEYDRYRMVADRRHDCYPALIARCAGVSDVRAALTLAREHGLEVAVRSGGHGHPGLSTVDDGLLLDLSLMNDVYVDVGRRTARIRPGARNGEIVRETAPFGLVPATGMSAEVGYGGIAIFGGLGYMGPRRGAVCDSVLSLDVVLADGQSVTASAVANPDLFWALRGAGDNFGVVTSFEVQLFPLPATVLVGSVHWELETALAAVEELWKQDDSLSDDLFWLLDVMVKNDGDADLALSSYHLGAPTVARRELARLSEIGTPISQTQSETSYLDLFYRPLHGVDRAMTNRVYLAATILRDLSPAAIEHIIEVARRASEQRAPENGWRRLSVYPYRKQASLAPTPPNAHTARDGLLLVAGVWYTDPADDETHEEWCDVTIKSFVRAGLTRTGWNAGLPHVVSRWNDEMIRGTFGDDYARLAEIKRRYDPENVFHRSTNARPEAVDGGGSQRPLSVTDARAR